MKLNNSIPSSVPNIINKMLNDLTKENVKDNKMLKSSHYAYQVPPVFYHNEIISLIDDYIREGFKSYDSLGEFEQDKLAIICMDLLDNDAYCAIIDHDDLFLTLHHLKMFMKTGQREYANDLAEIMNKNAREHFAHDLKIVYSERENIISKEVALNREIDYHIDDFLAKKENEFRTAA